MDRYIYFDRKQSTILLHRILPMFKHTHHQIICFLSGTFSLCYLLFVSIIALCQYWISILKSLNEQIDSTAYFMSGTYPIGLFNQNTNVEST